MTPQEYYKAAAVLFGEMRGQPDEAVVSAGSTLINRYDDFFKHWSFRGNYSDMLDSEYYAVRDAASGKNTGYAEATDYLTKKKPFKNKKDENDFKRVLQLWKGLNDGTIERGKQHFYFTLKEEESARKSMDFKKLKHTGSFKDRKGVTFNTYAYK